MPRGRGVAVEIPYRLIGVGKLVYEERSAIGFSEDPRVAPALTAQPPRCLPRQRAHIDDIDDELIAGSGSGDCYRARQRADLRDGRVSDVLGGVVVFNDAVKPLSAVQSERVSGFHMHGRGNIGMIAIMSEYLLVGERFRRVQWKYYFGHDGPFSTCEDGEWK